jgi:hypothetical protein
MKPKRKFNNRISIEIENVGVNDNNNMVVSYVGTFKGKEIFRGEYEFLETPESEDEFNNQLLKEIEALVKGYGNGVKH